MGKTKFLSIAFTVLFVGMVGLFFGCVKKGPSDQVTIKVSIWGTPEEIDILNKVIEQWQPTHPNIRVKLEHTSYGSYISKILTRIAGGAAPDVAFATVDTFVDFYTKGAFLDLKPFIDKDTEFKLNDFFPTIVKRFTVDGGIYCIPRDVAPFACVYYNKDLFDAADLPYPKDNWNWDKMLESAKKLTVQDELGRVEQYGFYTWAWMNFIFSNGGNLVDNVQNPTRLTLNNPKAIQGLQFMTELTTKHNVSPSQTSLRNLGMGSQQLFMTGKLAMYGSGIWETPVFRKITNFDWDIVMFPKGPRGKRAFATGGSGYCVLKSSQHPEEAWEVVKCLSGKTGQIIMAEEGLAQPANQIISKGKHWALSNKPPLNKKMLNEAVKHIVYFPFSQNWRRINDSIIGPEFDLMFNGQITPEEAVANITPSANKLLRGEEI